MHLWVEGFEFTIFSLHAQVLEVTEIVELVAVGHQTLHLHLTLLRWALLSRFPARLQFPLLDSDEK